MAKRKDLLLNESTISRMMGLAGIGSLANPFLKEQVGGPSLPADDQEEEGEDALEEAYEEEGEDALEEAYEEEGEDALEEAYEEEGEDALEEAYEEEGEDSLEEGKEEDEGEEENETCESCGMKEGKHKSDCGRKMNENIKASLRRLKVLLEQDAATPPPAEEPPAEEPPAPEGAGGGDDEVSNKIKEFVKKLGELVQETLGVQVTVEEEGEEKAPAEGGAPEGGAGAPPPAPPPEGGAGAPPPVMQEAISRLVNKVARRVKARLMEKKDPKVAAMKAKKMKMMKEKQMAAKKKEKEMAAKKKEMEMKKKKEAALKAKKK